MSEFLSTGMGVYATKYEQTYTTVFVALRREHLFDAVLRSQAYRLTSRSHLEMVFGKEGA